jgi:hypothetical protein
MGGIPSKAVATRRVHGGGNGPGRGHGGNQAPPRPGPAPGPCGRGGGARRLEALHRLIIQ